MMKIAINTITKCYRNNMVNTGGERVKSSGQREYLDYTQRVKGDRKTKQSKQVNKVKNI